MAAQSRLAGCRPCPGHVCIVVAWFSKRQVSDWAATPSLLMHLRSTCAARHPSNPAAPPLMCLQPQAGVVAAFGLVRGLGEASATLAPSGGSSSELVAGLDLSVQALGSAGLALGQCMLAAAFAATAVELGMQRGLVKPFGASGGEGSEGQQ